MTNKQIHRYLTENPPEHPLDRQEDFDRRLGERFLWFASVMFFTFSFNIVVVFALFFLQYSVHFEGLS